MRVFALIQQVVGAMSLFQSTPEYLISFAVFVLQGVGQSWLIKYQCPKIYI